MRFALAVSALLSGVTVAFAAELHSSPIKLLNTAAPINGTAQVNSGHVYGAQNRNFRVLLRTQSDTRITVRDGDGTLYLNRDLKSGDSYQVPTIPGLSMTASDGNAVELVVDGASLGAAGQALEPVYLDPAVLLDPARRVIAMPQRPEIQKAASLSKPSAQTSRENVATIPPLAPLPLGVRQRLAFQFEDSLSQVFGAEVTLSSLRSYKEQDGSETLCSVGPVQGKRFRIASPGSGQTITNPSQFEWLSVGCGRPNYQLLR